MQIHLFCLCWNEAKIIPYFFRHYSPLVDRFFIHDNGSTDGTLDLLRGEPRVSVTPFERRGDSFVAQERFLSDTIWQRSAGAADWVIVVDMDEHLYHPALPAYLAAVRSQGITAIRSVGYEMVADRFPQSAAALPALVTRGMRSLGHDRLCIFDPSAITATGYGLGRHTAAPSGRVVYPPSPEVAMLHYKYLGIDYVLARNAVLRGGLGARDRQMGWGIQYLRHRPEVAADFARIDALAGPVPGLCPTAPGPAVRNDDEAMLRRSGLFERGYYLTRNPDVSAAGVDPLAHYHAFGWREGRRPNPHFDPAWYLATYADAFAAPADPLLDYISGGERAGRRPCASFDPLAYRGRFCLPPGESPLRHFLQHGGAAPALEASRPR